MFAIAATFSLALALGKSRGLGRLICLAVVPLFLGGVMLTQTRGVIVATVIGLAYVLISGNPGRSVVALVASLVLFLVGLLVVPGVLDIGLGRIVGVDDTTRVEVYGFSIGLIADYPLGSGIGALYPLSGNLGYPHAHNMYLQMAVMTGLPGLALFVAVIWVGFRESKRWMSAISALQERRIAVALRGGLIATLLAFMTETSLITNVGVWFWCILGFMLAIGQAPQPRERPAGEALIGGERIRIVRRARIFTHHRG